MTSFCFECEGQWMWFALWRRLESCSAFCVLKPILWQGSFPCYLHEEVRWVGKVTMGPVPSGLQTSSSNCLRLYLPAHLTSSLPLCLEYLPVLRVSLLIFSCACLHSPPRHRGSGAFQPASIYEHICEKYVCMYVHTCMHRDINMHV